MMCSYNLSSVFTWEFYLQYCQRVASEVFLGHLTISNDKLILTIDW